MKKLMTVLLMALAVIPFVAANGSSDDDSTALKSVRILCPGDKVADQDKVAEYVSEVSGPETGARLEWMNVSWGDYRSKVQVLLAAGDPYELNFDADWMTFGANVSKGAYMNITDILKEEAPLLEDYISTDEWKAVSYEGDIYGIPWVFPKTERRSFWVREDLRQKYDLPEPTNMDNFETYLAGIKENEDVMPFMWGSDGVVNVFFTDYGLDQIGGQNLALYYYLEDDDMKIYAAEDLPMYEELVTRAHDWYDKGYIPVDAITARQNKTYKTNAGTLAAGYGLYSNEEQETNKMIAAGVDGELKCFPDYSMLSYRAPASNNMYAMNGNAENPAEALKFVQWVHASQENFDLLMYGIPGEHWELEGNSVKVLPSLEESKYYNWPAPWPLWDINYIRPFTGEPEDKYDLVKEHAMKNTIASPRAGFFPDLSSIKTEVALRTSLRSEMGVGLEYGIMDPAKIDEYRAAQKESTAIIIAELQKQLDAWRAASN